MLNRIYQVQLSCEGEDSCCEYFDLDSTAQHVLLTAEYLRLIQLFSART